MRLRLEVAIRHIFLRALVAARRGLLGTIAGLCASIWCGFGRNPVAGHGSLATRFALGAMALSLSLVTLHAARARECAATHLFLVVGAGKASPTMIKGPPQSVRSQYKSTRMEKGRLRLQ